MTKLWLRRNTHHQDESSQAFSQSLAKQLVADLESVCKLIQHSLLPTHLSVGCGCLSLTVWNKYVLRDVYSSEGQGSALIATLDQDQPFMLQPAPLHTSLFHTNSPIHHINSLGPSLYYYLMHSHPFTLHVLFLSITEQVLPFFLFPFSQIFVFLKPSETSSPSS